MSEDTQKYIENQFAWITAELGRLRQAIEKLAESTITEKAFERILERVGVCENELDIHRNELSKVEGELKMMRGVGMFLVGILGTIVAAWLKNILGV